MKETSKFKTYKRNPKPHELMQTNEQGTSRLFRTSRNQANNRRRNIKIKINIKIKLNQYTNENTPTEKGTK